MANTLLARQWRQSCKGMLSATSQLSRCMQQQQQQQAPPMQPLMHVKHELSESLVQPLVYCSLEPLQRQMHGKEELQKYSRLFLRDFGRMQPQACGRLAMASSAAPMASSAGPMASSAAPMASSAAPMASSAAAHQGQEGPSPPKSASGDSSGGSSDGGSSGGSANKPGGGRSVRSGPVTWGSLLLLLITGAGIVTYFENEKKKRLEKVRQLASVGKAAIGGPFLLTDDKGKRVTEKDFKGLWNLVYFGFTFCPDICPAELKKMAEAVERVEKNTGLKLRPIFISVDPERDGVKEVSEYVKGFHPRMVGLTGSVEEVKAAAKQYRVYYMKTDEQDKENYLVDHSIIMYLMDPQMEFVKFFGRNHTAESLADGIQEEVSQWTKSTK